MSQPQFTEGTKRLLSAHPALAPSRTRELGADFAARQATVGTRLAALGYPLERVMQELRSGHLPYFREGSDQDRKEGGRKAAYRFAGFTPTHQEEHTREARARQEGSRSVADFAAWEAKFLMRFTFEVLEQVALRALPAPAFAPEDSAAVRRQLAEALTAARRLRDEILCGNLLLVAQIAIRRGRFHATFSLDELFTAGTDGLLIAINRYDPSVAHFSTYATPWIAMAIDRFAAKNRHVIRIPIGLQEKARREGGEAAALIPQVQSLDEALPGSDGEMHLEDVVADPTARQPLETAERSDIARLLEAGVRELSPLKQLIIALRSEVGDAAALGAELFRQEAALALARGRATAAAAAKTTDEPAQIHLITPAIASPVPEAGDLVHLAVAV
jgi:RNA polymerase sigma factor (sigma-70 family)